jgi:xeroderma pigmentosum group C-complementing protein
VRARGGGCPIAFVDPLDFHRAVLASSATTSAAAAAADAEADDADVVVLDVRNWYESRVGHFDGARLLPLRRFGQLPEYFDSRCPPDLVAGKEVYMYCTGGIRCEKAAEYLAGLAPGPDGAPRAPRAVKKLRGGIVAYQVRSIQTFFTHRSVSITLFDRVSPFQLTDELFLYHSARRRGRRGARAQRV